MNPTPTESQLTEKAYDAESILLEAIKGFYMIYTQPHLSYMMKEDLRGCVMPLVEKYFIIKFQEAAKLDSMFGAMQMMKSSAFDTIAGIVERACKGRQYGAVGEYNEEIIGAMYRIEQQLKNANNNAPRNPA